jgi:hypothetical protein
MKLIKMLVLILAITYSHIEAQNLDGTYVCDDQILKISGNHIEYKLISFGDGLNTIFTGTGNIMVQDKKLYISPDDIMPSKNGIIERESPLSIDTMIISIRGDEPEQIVIKFFKRDKEIFTVSGTDRIGKVPRNKIIGCDSILIGIIGYKSTGQKINNVNDHDYEVELYPYDQEDIKYEFVTNNRQGFKMKISTNLLCLKYERIKNNKEKQMWNRFKKIN